MRFIQHKSGPFPAIGPNHNRPLFVLGLDEEGVVWEFMEGRENPFVSEFQALDDLSKWLDDGSWVEIPSNPFAPKQGVPEKPRCKDEDLDPYMTPMEEREHSLKNRLFTLLDEMKTFGTIVLDKPEWPNELFEEWKKK